MRRDLTCLIADYLGYTEMETRDAALLAPSTYKRFLIPKKTKGMRTIYQPSVATKALQYALMDCFLATLPVHICATAYRPGIRSPLLRNAKLHAGYSYTVRVDVTDFFPSIVPEDLLNVPQVAQMGLTDKEVAFLAAALFLRPSCDKNCLAIGAPSSPMVSNIVMYAMDEQIDNLSQSLSGVYTRYADDIVFSSSELGVCAEFTAGLATILDSTRSPRLVLNRDKTRFMSRGTRRTVTGLFIGHTGRVSIGRRKKRHIRALVWAHVNGGLGQRDQAYLRGYLAFILDVDPAFFATLETKYGRPAIASIMVSG